MAQNKTQTDMAYLVALAIPALALFLIPIFRVLFWRPFVFTKLFRQQGITGPPYALLSGSLPEINKLRKAALDEVLDTNSNDITQRVIPHYHTWFALYGRTFLYWYGTLPRVCISDAELAKQILSNKLGLYPRSKQRPALEILIGKLGLVLVHGTDWVKHRRILTPAFSSDKIKFMIRRMAACSISMLDEWKQKEKINGDEQFMRLTSEIIAHTAFGSSYVQGKEAFNAQKELQHLCSTSAYRVFIPGTQYLPTPSNLKTWKLQRDMTSSLRCIIEARLSSSASQMGRTGPSNNPWGDDLLGLMIGASESSPNEKTKFSMDEILDECKTFFFAGQETTSNLLTWTVFLLSLHQDWQERLREEVHNECGQAIPDADMLAKLKLVNMVLLETLRLYGPVIELIREASQDTKLGSMMIPKGTSVVIPLVTIHRDKDYWGKDADEFNPMRFVNGVSKAAKHPNAFLAFGLGPRTCIGQNFAMIEAKTVMALLLQRFSVSLSHEYKHAPVENLTLQPQFGLPLLLKPLHP